MTTQPGSKRTLEGAGLDLLVKGMNDTGITRANVLKPEIPFSTKDFMKRSLYGYGSQSASSNGTGSSLENVHSIFAAGLERRRRAAMMDLGYGDKSESAADEAGPPVKRRRFQRRNSKTPAMLFKSMNFLPQDLFTDDVTPVTEFAMKYPMKPAVTKPVAPSSKADNDDDWDGGLEIAEQLVKHLQKRRLSDLSAH